MNYPLLIFDLILLPLTVSRAIVIYFFGSRYNIPNMRFLDVVQHAKEPFFNQKGDVTVDVVSEDIRFVVHNESIIYKDIKDNIGTNNNLEEHVNNEIKPSSLNVTEPKSNIFNKISIKPKIETSTESCQGSVVSSYDTDSVRDLGGDTDAFFNNL